MTIRERAERIFNSGLPNRIRQTNPEMHAALVEAITKELAPPLDHVRDDKGVDRRVLGTLLITADGCVAGSDCEVFHPLSVWTRGLSVRDGEVTVPTKSGPDGFVCRSEIACVSKCYSTREAALAAHPNEKGSAHGE